MGSAAVAQASAVATPAFSPAAGTYTSAQSVKITTTTSGASIRYTTNGTAPTSTTGTVYSSPVSISATTKLEAIAYKSGDTNSAVTSGTYTINLTVAAPAFSPAAGTYTSAQSVTITTATSGATIRYTTNGTAPTTTTGTVYSGPVPISATTTLEAIAYETGFTNSAVTSGTYTLTVAVPAFSPAAGTYTSAQSVTITTATSSASIRYTTSGTAPTSTTGTVYSGSVSINATATLEAIAYETGYTTSTVTSGKYTINLTVAAPTFSPVAGTYTSVQSVTISSATSGATIRYTTSGTAPTTTSGTVYSGPASINATAILKAIAYETGYTNSAVSSGTYTIKATPVVSWPAPAAITYGTALSSTQLNATANTPGTFVYTPATGTVLGAGSQTLAVAFTPTDTTDYNNASASVSLTVNAKPVTFTISPVSFAYNGSAHGPTITPSVAGATFSTAGTASATAAGSYAVSATATGNYSGTSGPIAWTIAKATPVVSWTTPAAITYGTALSSTQLNATANVPGTFVYTPSAGTILAAGSQMLSVAFTPTDAIDYNNASASVSLTVNAKPVTFTISPVSFTYQGSAQGPTITPSVAGATFSTAGTASATAAGSYTVTATATGNYTGTGGPTAWTINKANAGVPSIAASANPSIFPATVTFTPANGTTGAYVWSINGNSIATYNGSSWSPASGTFATGTWSTSGLNLLVTPTSATNYTVVFSDTGNGNYNPASSATTTETVNPPPPLAPVFSPAGGTFTSAQSVTITSSGSTAIYYTTNSSTPTTASTVYSGPVSISSATILSAIGINAGGSSPVTSATYAIDQPPTITPNAPSLTFSSSDDVSLSFNASDATGSVASVVLSSTEPGIPNITLTSPTSGSTWTFTEASTLAPGTYTFTATATNSFGTPTTSAPVTVTVLPSLPYLTDFETNEGYILGSLNQQLGWSVPQGSALVTNQDFFSGSQSAVLQPSVPPAQITQVFAPFVPPIGTPNIIFVDFYAKPVAEADVTTATTFNIGSARFAFVLNAGQGMLEAFNGNGSGGGTWSPTNFTAPIAANNQLQNWIHLTARLDFTQGTWDLYANGAMVAASLGFLDSTSTMLTAFSVQGDASTASEVDDILAGTNNPLFADVNNDGIDDAWETAHGLSLSVNDRNLTAANGSTVLQDYINGIDPTDYYGGMLPVLTSLVDPSGMPGAQGFVSIKVTRASDGTPLANAPVTLAVTTGASTISTTSTPGSLISVNVLTDSNGIASGYVNFIGSAADVLVATAQSGTQTASVSITLNPSSINGTGLQLWLKADAGVTVTSGQVTAWQDQSIPGGHDATAPAGSGPTLVSNGLNGKPVMEFGGSSSMSLPGFMGTATAGEMFIVLKAATAAPTAWNASAVEIGGFPGLAYTNPDGKIYDSFGVLGGYYDHWFSDPADHELSCI